MKIKQIESICKQAKKIAVIETHEGQWLSDGYAAYPVYNLPKLTKEIIFAMFDVPSEKRDKFQFIHENKDDRYNFEDNDPNELHTQQEHLYIFKEGRLLLPLYTSNGVSFIDRKYIRPFENEENGYDFYERKTPDGRTYIVAKSGLLIVGIMIPFDCFDQNFIQQLVAISEAAQVALFKKEQAESEADDGQTTIEI